MSEQIYCGQCGSKNPTSNKFCGKCGAVLNVLQESSSDLPPMQSISHPNACPKCKSIDQIQKLSAIITSGTRITSGVSTTMGETNFAGSQRYYAQVAGYIGNSELSGKAYSASSTLIDATEQSDLAKKLSPPRKPQEPVLKRILEFFEGLVFSDKRKSAKNEYDRQKQEFQQKLAEWEKAYKRWEQMYYCYRDDVVFVLGDR